MVELKDQEKISFNDMFLVFGLRNLILERDFCFFLLYVNFCIGCQDYLIE